MANFGELFGGFAQGLAQGLPAGIQLGQKQQEIGQKQEQIELHRQEVKLSAMEKVVHLEKWSPEALKTMGPAFFKGLQKILGPETLTQAHIDGYLKGNPEQQGAIREVLSAAIRGDKIPQEKLDAVIQNRSLNSALELGKDISGIMHQRKTEQQAERGLFERRADRREARDERRDARDEARLDREAAARERRETSSLGQHEKVLDNNRAGIKEENQSDFVAALVKHPDYREAVGTRNRTRMDEIAAEIRGANPNWNKKGDRESKIADAMKEIPGLTRGEAAGKVDGLIKTIPNPVTGMIQVIDGLRNTVREIPVGSAAPTTPAETPAQRDAKSADEVGDLLTQAERGPRFVQRDPTTKTAPAGVLPPEPLPGRPQNKPLYESAGEGKIAGIGSAVKELWSSTVGQIIPPGKQWQATLEARQDAKILARDFVRALQVSPRMAEGERASIAKEIDIAPSMWDSKVHLQARMRSIDSRLRERLVDARKDAADPNLNQEMRGAQSQNARHIQNFIGKLGVPPKGLPESYTRMGTTKEGFPVYGSPNVDRKKWMVDQY